MTSRCASETVATIGSPAEISAGARLPAKPLYGGRVFLQPGICPGSIENGLHERALELGKVLPRYEAGAPFGRQPLGNGGWP